MPDHIRNFLFDNHPVRGQWVRLEAVYQKVMQQHAYPQPIADLLAEALVAVLMLVGAAKRPGKVSLQFQSGGHIKLISVQCDANGYVRGLVDWDKTQKDIDLESALSQGHLVTLYQPDDSTQHYQSVVPIQGGSIAKALEHYFIQSEQQMTSIHIARNEQYLTGFLLQMMPEDTDAKGQSWEHVTHLADTLSHDELLTCDDTTLLTRLYHQETVRAFDVHPVQFGCQNNRQRFENAVLSLGRQEAEKILDSHTNIEITCEFCNKQFLFDRIDVETLFKGVDGGDAETDTHH